MVQTVGQTRIQNPSYIVNRSGVYYYSRRVPLDLRGQFGKKRIMVSLKTKSRDRALASAMVLSEKIESFWNGLRLEAILSTQLPKKVTKGHSPSVNFLDALDIYLRLKGVGKGDNFIRTARRNITELVCYLGNRDISEVSSADAGGFRDHLFDKGLSSSSVKRCFASVRAITRLAITEQGLGIANPFAEIFIPADADKKKRPPIPNDVIQEIQAQCVHINDENRWLIALISDTGLRLSEALGLATADFYLDGPSPYVTVKEHPWRSLKTSSSVRDVPLVGAFLWAAQRIVATGNPFAFPRYTSGNACISNSASAALNKWLKPRVPDGCVIHSFRHSLRDRLRAVECPSEMADAIGGWASTGIGKSYGQGFNLVTKHKWLKAMVESGTSIKIEVMNRL